METGTDSRPILLASASPRRRELLGLLGVRFVVVVSRFDEAALSQSAGPEEYTRQAAEGKAREVARRRAGIILGVDTDVFAPDGGAILGKPENADDARRMLRRLSGRTHSVFSGVALMESDGAGNLLRQESRVVETRVTFADLPPAAIDAYVATGEPMDKAGAYAIQGRAMPFVSKVDGDVSSVIGLPLAPVAQMLANFGVPVWQFAADAAAADAPE